MSKPKQYSIKKPYIQKVLDISTGHVTQSDVMLLRSCAISDTAWGPIVMPYEEGVIVAVSSDDETFAADLIMWAGHFSKEFCKVISVAHDRGCTYVKFDQDGIEYTDLKVFNW
jgi:hypothetical protein